MDELRAIQILALKAALKPTSDDFLRKIFRWYSKTFYTPLHVVETLPLSYILSTYYENQYEEMDEQDLEDVRKKLLETDAERRARELEEERADIEADTFAKEVEEQEKGKPKPKTSLKDLVSKTKTQVGLKPDFKETELPSPTEIPQDVKITFEPEEEFEKSLNSDSLGLLDP